jgi:nucleoside-triphosphatase
VLLLFFKKTFLLAVVVEAIQRRHTRKKEQSMKVLLTSKHGCDKGLIFHKFLKQYSGKVNGIYSRAVRDSENKRVGFEAVTIDGRSRLIAHTGQFMASAGVADDKYFVDIHAIETFVVPEIERAAEDKTSLLVIDEIGKIEACSDRFMQLIAQLFNGPNYILATISQEPESWSVDFKRHPAVRIVNVDPTTRDSLIKYLHDVFAPLRTVTMPSPGG